MSSTCPSTPATTTRPVSCTIQQRLDSFAFVDDTPDFVPRKRGRRRSTKKLVAPGKQRDILACLSACTCTCSHNPNPSHYHHRTTTVMPHHSQGWFKLAIVSIAVCPWLSWTVVRPPGGASTWLHVAVVWSVTTGHHHLKRTFLVKDSCPMVNAYRKRRMRVMYAASTCVVIVFIMRTIMAKVVGGLNQSPFACDECATVIDIHVCSCIFINLVTDSLLITYSSISVYIFMLLLRYWRYLRVDVTKCIIIFGENTPLLNTDRVT